MGNKASSKDSSKGSKKGAGKGPDAGGYKTTLIADAIAASEAGRAKKKKGKSSQKSTTTSSLQTLQEDIFSDLFRRTAAHNTKKNANFEAGDLGDYAVVNGDRKAVIRICEQTWNNSIVVVYVINSDCGLSTNEFVRLYTVQKFAVGQYTANQKLNPVSQQNQVAIHAFLRDATPVHKFVPPVVEESVKLVLVEKPEPVQVATPHNKHKQYASDQSISDSIVSIVSHKAGIFRLMDKNGRCAVISKSSGLLSGKESATIHVKYVQDGHELHGSVAINTSLDVWRLAQELNQGDTGRKALHAFLRECAAEAGIKWRNTNHLLHIVA